MADVRLSAEFFTDPRFDILNESIVSDSVWDTKYRMIQLWQHCFNRSTDVISHEHIKAAMGFPLYDPNESGLGVIDDLLCADLIEATDKSWLFRIKGVSDRLANVSTMTNKSTVQP